MIPLQMGDKMVFDNTILLWGIKHSENGYELKDIFPTSSFNDYPIFIGNKKICFTHFIVIKVFFFFKGSRILKYRREKVKKKEQEDMKKEAKEPITIDWSEIKKLEIQEKEKENRKYVVESSNTRHSTEEILEIFGLPRTKVEFEDPPIVPESPTQLPLQQLISNLKSLDLQNKNPQWRRLFPGRSPEEKRKETEIKKIEWMGEHPLIINIKPTEEEEFKKSKFWKQFR
jgi:hypothetical protein